MYDIISIGEALHDIFIQVPTSLLCPAGKPTCEEPFLCMRYGTKMDIEKIYFDVGGSACNGAVAFARLGLKSAYMGMIGKDNYGREIYERLVKERVGKDLLLQKKEFKTGFAFIINGPTGDRTIFIYRGKGDYKKLDFKKIIGKSKRIFIWPLPILGNFVLDKLADLAHKFDLEIFINLGSRQIGNKRITKKILAISKILFLNKEEAELFIGKTKDIFTLLRLLKKMGPQIVVLTAGSDGAFVFDGKIFYNIDNFPVRVIDTTGAGDAFAATFVASYLTSRGNIPEAMTHAAVNAASVVSVFGAQTGLLKKRELLGRLKKHPGFKAEIIK